VPRSEVARGLAIVEAVADQLYLAVMIAYSAGQQVSRSHHVWRQECAVTLPNLLV
jgi:hypothetical protein